MATVRPAGWHQGDLDVHHARNWLIGVGIALAILGVLAVIFSVATTAISIVVLGGLLIVGGLVQIVHAFSAGRWTGVVLSLLAGVLYVVTGMLLVARPIQNAVALTLLLAAFLMVAGLVRILSVPILEMPNWGWVLASGVISLLLGLAVWTQWPSSGLWLIGTYVGIEMIVHGIELGMLGGALPERPAARARREAA